MIETVTPFAALVLNNGTTLFHDLRPSNENVSIRFLRQYVPLFASIATTVLIVNFLQEKFVLCLQL